MKQYKVQITDKALADMEAIYEYIAAVLGAPETAMKQSDWIADGIESLNVFPERCKLFDSPAERELGMRQLRVDNYSAVYVVDEDTVTVLRVLYGASDLSARLQNDR